MFASTLTWPAGTVISVASVFEVPNPSDLAIRHMQGKGFEDWRQILEQSHTTARDQARRYTADAAAALRARHQAVDVDEVICLGEPAAELLVLARSVEAELLIAGARGHTALECLLLGSVSEALVTEAPCPVLIVRAPVTELRTVIVALRTPDDADRLAEACLRLPLPTTTRLVAVTASAPRPIASPGRQPFAPGEVETLLAAWAEDDRVEAELAGQRFVERVRAGDPGRTVETRVIRGELHPSVMEPRADVVPALLAEAKALDASLMVVGAREHHGLTARLGLGSVSRKLVRRAPMAVLVVREAPE